MIKVHHITGVTVKHGRGLEDSHFSPQDYLEILRAASIQAEREINMFTPKKERVKIGKAAIEYQVTLARLGRNLPIFPED